MKKQQQQNGSVKPGTEIKMKNGGALKIQSFIGDGGQGEVYKVQYEGKPYALKWYKKAYLSGMRDPDGFYKNLENNIIAGPPTQSFLWPVGLTEKTHDSYGYIMAIRPDNYMDLRNFFQKSKDRPQVHFPSYKEAIRAAINITQGFRTLHNKGFSYQDINDGNFFIDPKTGDVLICDNDNVSPYGNNFGIMGKQRWMAPEIVTGKNAPDKKSDLFSLSVVLFRLFFINHPLEGAYSTPPCMTKAYERKFFGEAPLFIFDPSDNRNRPIRGTDANLQRFWPIYPQYLKDLFIRAFSQDVMIGDAPRVLEIEWLNVLFRMLAEVGSCPTCKLPVLYPENGTGVCPHCGKAIPERRFLLKLPEVELPLFLGMKLWQWNVDSHADDTETVLGEVISNPKKPGLLGLRNLSGSNWTATLPSGEQKNVASASVVPLSAGITIQFKDKTGSILS